LLYFLLDFIQNETTENTEEKLIKELCELFRFLKQRCSLLKRIHSERKKSKLSAERKGRTHQIAFARKRFDNFRL
jgi:hypothetical protein